MFIYSKGISSFKIDKFVFFKGVFGVDWRFFYNGGNILNFIEVRGVCVNLKIENKNVMKRVKFIKNLMNVF